MHQLYDIENEPLRKMVEGIFHNSDTMVSISVIPNQAERKASAKTEGNQRTYALVVGNKDEPYNETLRKIKDTLKDYEDIEGIKSFRSTREGRIIISTEKNTKTLNDLESTLKGNTELQNVTWIGHRREKRVIHIRGIDALTCKEEVNQNPLQDNTNSTPRIFD